MAPEAKRTVCPICQHDLEKLRYAGGNAEVLSWYRMSRPSCGNMDFMVDSVEDGRQVWIVDGKGAHGYCE